MTTGVEHDDVLVNEGLLIGLQAFKCVQLSLRLTVRTLTRPWIAQLSRNRRAVENGRRRADCDSALLSLGDVLCGLPEWSRSLTVLASLWRFKSLNITLTPQTDRQFCGDSIQYFACQWLAISVQVLTYVWASSKCEYEWYTPDNNSMRNTLRLIARNLQGEIWWVA